MGKQRLLNKYGEREAREHLISIIIPTYNRSRFIAEAIGSVFKQTDKSSDLEVIVVDDGSTDNTEQVVKSLNYPVHYIKISHSGLPSVVRNVGLASAKGSLIAFQDSDDFWAEDKLTSQLKAFDDPKVVLSYGNAEIVDENAKKTGKLVISPEQAHSGAVFDWLVKENFVSTLTVIARKDAIMKVGGFNESSKLRAVEDYHLWLKLAETGQFLYINRPLALYRRHEDNISSNNQIGSLKLLVTLFKMLRVDIPTKRPVIDKQLAKLFQDLSQLSSWPASTIYKVKAKLRGYLK